MHPEAHQAVMLDYLPIITEPLTSLKEIDISFAEHGEVSGFHAAQAEKNDYCQFVEDIISKVALYIDVLSLDYLDGALTNINQSIGGIKSVTDQIVILVKEGLHTPGYPAQRTKLIEALKTQHSNLKKAIHPLTMELQVIQLEKKIGEGNYLDQKTKEIDNYIEQIKASVSEANKALKDTKKARDVTQDSTVKEGLAKSKSHFATLHDNHQQYQWGWFGALIVACGSLLFAVNHALDLEILFVPGNADSGQIANSAIFLTTIELTKRLLLVSVAGVFLKLTLTKYNAERYLKIIYAHREKVLDQYKSFEAGIGEDNAEAKNQFRLEVVRYIFSDPNSNYGDSSESNKSEININPVLPVIERLQ